MKKDSEQLKMKILEAAVKKHESVIYDFRERIKQLMATSGNVNEEEYDAHVQSQKLESVTEVSLLSDQLQFASTELEELRRLGREIKTPHEKVVFGTVVVTDHDTFFVSTSIERFSLGDKSIFGLSVHSPLYKVMRGKKAGERFRFKNTDYAIREIF